MQMLIKLQLNVSLAVEAGWGGVAFKHESCEFVYRICSLALRGTQPALALVVSVGNCSISAAYQLFDFPREPRIAEITSWWKSPGYKGRIKFTSHQQNSTHPSANTFVAFGSFLRP